eukprot:scaffold129087_cov66-Phaeocystis_antarctica.AAC.3
MPRNNNNLKQPYPCARPARPCTLESECTVHCKPLTYMHCAARAAGPRPEISDGRCWCSH